MPSEQNNRSSGTWPKTHGPCLATSAFGGNRDSGFPGGFTGCLRALRFIVLVSVRREHGSYEAGL